MSGQDTSLTKERIISILNRRGPSLPIHIAKEMGMSLLFTSAFLSELYNEKRIKISNMRVGNSPIYFLEGQEKNLEEFSKHLGGKEKEAYNLLKEKSILEDTLQEPAIRVALRSIKDFAIPFEKNQKLFWKGITTKEEKILDTKDKIDEISKEIPLKEKVKKIKRAIKKNNQRGTKDDQFFNRVKEFITQRNIEIIDIISFNKKELVLKVSKSDENWLIIAYNQKKISDKEIINANKKTKETGLNYSIIALGEPSKKTSSLIESLKNLKDLQKLE